MATSASGLMNGNFCLWFDEWRLLPMIRLMATSAYGSIDGDLCLWFDWWRLLPVVWLNGDFCLWFDEWRLLPLVRLMASFAACGLINGDFCLWFDWWRFLPMVWWMATSASSLIEGFLSWEMATSAGGLINSCLLPLMVWLIATSACGLIDGVFCRLWFDWWRLLPVVWLYGRFCQNDWLMGFWLMCFIPRSDDFCQDTDRWALSPRNNYFTINWDVILGRMPIIGLIIGPYPRQWYVYGVDPL